MKKGIKKSLKRNQRLAYLMLMPALILVAIFLVYPTFALLYESLCQWKSAISEPVFVGLKNYRLIVKNPDFWNAIKNTLVYTSSLVVFSVLIGLVLALPIERRVTGWKIYKFCFYIVVMLSSVVIGSLFFRILDPDIGVLNNFLRMVGLDALCRNWLSSPDTAMGTVIAVTVWHSSGYTMLLLLVAMEGIDPAIQEAATVDGITEWKRIFYITLPCIKRSILVVAMLQIIGGFKAYDMIKVLTDGGPGTTTDVLATMLYKTAFEKNSYGSAAAISVVMVVLVAIVSFIYLKIMNLSEQVVE